jgi:hypothetical protein
MPRASTPPGGLQRAPRSPIRRSAHGFYLLSTQRLTLMHLTLDWRTCFGAGSYILFTERLGCWPDSFRSSSLGQGMTVYDRCGITRSCCGCRSTGLAWLVLTVINSRPYAVIFKKILQPYTKIWIPRMCSKPTVQMSRSGAFAQDSISFPKRERLILKLVGPILFRYTGVEFNLSYR